MSGLIGIWIDRNDLYNQENEMLRQFQERCKYGVDVRFNAHRDGFDSVMDYMSRWEEECDSNVLNEMIKRDTTIEILLYPDNTRKHIVVWHYDYVEALKEAWVQLYKHDEQLGLNMVKWAEIETKVRMNMPKEK